MNVSANQSIKGAIRARGGVQAVSWNLNVQVVPFEVWQPNFCTVLFFCSNKLQWLFSVSQKLSIPVDFTDTRISFGWLK